MVSELFKSGSLFGSFIDPETSTKNTKFAPGRFFASIALPFRPIRTKRCPAAHGASLGVDITTSTA